MSYVMLKSNKRATSTVVRNNDYANEVEHTFEEHMYNKLSTYVDNLHQFRNNIIELNKALTINFPLSKISTPKKTVKTISTIRILPYTRKESPINRIIKKNIGNLPARIILIQNSRSQIEKSKTWMRLNFTRILSPKLVSKQINLNLTQIKFNKALPNISQRKNIKLIKKSPYQFIPKSIRAIVIRRCRTMKTKRSISETAKPFGSLIK